MLKVIVVRVGKTRSVEEFGTFKAVQRAIGIRSGQEWEVLETNMPGIGIVARDQDNNRLKQNRIGVMGDFIIMGVDVKKDESGKTFIFSGLNEAKISEATVALGIGTFNHMLGLQDGKDYKPKEEKK